MAFTLVDLSDMQRRVLVALRDLKVATRTHIADATGLTASQVSTALNRLECLGYVHQSAAPGRSWGISKAGVRLGGRMSRRRQQPQPQPQKPDPFYVRVYTLLVQYGPMTRQCIGEMLGATEFTAVDNALRHLTRKDAVKYHPAHQHWAAINTLAPTPTPPPAPYVSDLVGITDDDLQYMAAGRAITARRRQRVQQEFRHAA